MTRKPKIKPSDFYDWGTEKYGKRAFWDKNNWRKHLYHEVLLTHEETFRETLKDPDRIYPDLDDSNRSSYYKLKAIEKGGSYFHANVVIINNPKRIPAPCKESYVIVATAIDKDRIKEEGRIRPRFIKK